MQRADIHPPDPPPSDGVVALRPAISADLAGLLEDGADPDIQRWTNVPFPYGEQEARRELEWFTNCWDDASQPLALVVADAETDHYLGAVVLFCDRPDGIVELGYGVNPHARGKGVGTRAIRLASHWAFSALDAKRLEARTDPENAASQRLLANVGFTREGLERQSREIKSKRCDMVCWSLLPSDIISEVTSADCKS